VVKTSPVNVGLAALTAASTLSTVGMAATVKRERKPPTSISRRDLGGTPTAERKIDGASASVDTSALPAELDDITTQLQVATTQNAELSAQLDEERSRIGALTDGVHQQGVTAGHAAAADEIAGLRTQAGEMQRKHTDELTQLAQAHEELTQQVKHARDSDIANARKEGWTEGVAKATTGHEKTKGEMVASFELYVAELESRHASELAELSRASASELPHRGAASHPARHSSSGRSSSYRTSDSLHHSGSRAGGSGTVTSTGRHTIWSAQPARQVLVPSQSLSHSSSRAGGRPPHSGSRASHDGPMGEFNRRWGGGGR